MIRIGSALCYARTIEDSAIEQIAQIESSAIGGTDAHIRIMPDAHSGSGCVIGTTMRVIDRAIPSVVGVDIGCGVLAYHLSRPLSADEIYALDRYCSDFVVSGQHVRAVPLADCGRDYVSQLICVDALRSEDYIAQSLGTLGGGNHFIELDVGADGSHWLIVHSGSRHLGVEVARYYQALITDTGYLSGQAFRDYLHDIDLCQRWAFDSRRAILDEIMTAFGWECAQQIESIHNYIDVDSMILRKGAISAQRGEPCLIPLNMRDGTLICVGRGSAEWNYSAPHGAGRLLSRRAARASVDLSDFRQAMSGIVSSTVCADTLDESPFAYKDYHEIMDIVRDTVDIVDRIRPVFNYKATT